MCKPVITGLHIFTKSLSICHLNRKTSIYIGLTTTRIDSPTIEWRLLFMTDYILLIVGLIMLVIGGDILVRGAVGLAEKLSIPPLIIGLTIVSFGTSMPEMLVSVNAALDGVSGLSVGNVVGSNIANVLLVLGLPALIRTTDCSGKGIGRNILLCIGITVIFMGALSTGHMGRIVGIILLVLMVLFFYEQVLEAKKARAEGEEEPDYLEEVENHPTSYPMILLLLVIGIGILPIGSNLTVDAATAIAKSWNVSDEVIGLTVVAFGTSLPELATTAMAVIRSNTGVALGNIVGSNILNILAIMGVTTTIAPVIVSQQIIHFDMWVMLAATLALALFAHFQVKIDRKVGGLMVFAYVVYVYAVYHM